MRQPETRTPTRPLDEDEALRSILEGTAGETGAPFFEALVRSVSRALGTCGAWVTEYDPARRQLRALAFWLNGRPMHGWEGSIDGTPCREVIDDARLVLIPDRVFDLYPGDPDLRGIGAVSYMGVPLQDGDGRILGHLAVLHTEPLAEDPRMLAVFRIFAARAAAEVRRLRAEQEVREREEKLSRLLGSAMDAIIELGDGLCVTRVNPAAEKLFRLPAGDMVGLDFAAFISPECRAKLEQLVRELGSRPEGQQYLWIPGGLKAARKDGGEFPAEASLSRYQLCGATYHTLILRNVNDRLEAERRIESLEDETEYLREELRDILQVGDIVGRSPKLLAALRDIDQVAPTDATVLVLGETGTGKEVVARAIHAASPRRRKPLIKVNCAAIPANLIESELFGHERGAFTGATARREGRFALADGGTIFLDEVGELPLELQPKLLRVLQEGELEPVGSARTHRVDVRVIAATNRDLDRMMQGGAFREDLYYRLAVFPLTLPPLRERGEDVLLLAQAFVERFARKMGRPVPALSADCRRRLLGYDWPGNVRELQNAIERAVITARDGRLSLERVLPEPAPRAVRSEPEAAADDDGGILTVAELERRERENLRRALAACGWKVSGPGGAAERLGIKPSTLSSRIKALGIVRPG